MRPAATLKIIATVLELHPALTAAPPSSAATGKPRAGAFIGGPGRDRTCDLRIKSCRREVRPVLAWLTFRVEIGGFQNAISQARIAPNALDDLASRQTRERVDEPELAIAARRSSAHCASADRRSQAGSRTRLRVGNKTRREMRPRADLGLGRAGALSTKNAHSPRTRRRHSSVSGLCSSDLQRAWLPP
jgi:hypothetical protein